MGPGLMLRVVRQSRDKNDLVPEQNFHIYRGKTRIRDYIEAPPTPFFFLPSSRSAHWKVRSTERFHPPRNIVEQPKGDDIPCGKSRPLGYRGRLENIGYRVHQSKSQKRDSYAIHSSSMNQLKSIHRRRRN
ncbi:hypothetical protein KY290_008868 [Solanum tuberosum]|uniref:Uncharacterized protein n=1 Tax=Solanum tuberosum TaxID=4113 RepID=A0ABQ7UN32_SOLTU|nr:hypothetical protein KY284_028669 [Solanum tuberosum]KAH0667504.1 hypothetical protein KY285_028710 [Solanum tuberosum]KAH0711220.1 hypothetical protein KY285_015679 [Solanum tuberosum]KAH0721383.1 hypothetical protein KY284_006413 [Solanum tuberosum]KAH0750444.1 hypothetical protein KY290_029676 [Solanum tuberosum]